MKTEEIEMRREKIKKLATTLTDELKAFEEEGVFMWYPIINYIKDKGELKR